MRRRETRQVRQRGSAPRTRAGFTLIETALATVIVGVGVLAIVSAHMAFHKQNRWSTHASIAMRLGNEIREMTLNLPNHDPVTGDANWGPETSELTVEDYDDLDDFDGEDGAGVIFEPPVNGMAQNIANMDGWSQEVRVFNVDPFDITEEVDDNDSDMMMVEVIVKYQGASDPAPEEVTRVSWIAPK